MSHLHYMSHTIKSNQDKISTLSQTLHQLRSENHSLKTMLAEEKSPVAEKKKEEKVKEDLKGTMRLIAKRMTDDLKAQFEMQMHRTKQSVDTNLTHIRESILHTTETLTNHCDHQLALIRTQIEAKVQHQLEELTTLFQSQIANVKHDMKQETNNMIIEKKSEIVKESFDDSGLLENLTNCQQNVRNVAAQLQQMDQDFMDRVKRIIKGELKAVKQNTVRTIMKETTAQNSRLKYYVRNLYAMLRLDMKRLDDVVNDYELMEHTNPENLRGSLLLQKKCMGVVVAPRRIHRKQSHSEAEGAQDADSEQGQQGEGVPTETPYDESQQVDEDAEDAEIRVTPGVAVALEYIYSRTPFNQVAQKQLALEVENLNKNIEEAVKKSETDTSFQLKHIEKILESKVSKLLLSESLKDNDVIQDMKGEFVKVRDHVTHILDTFMTREQIYSCLRQKADVTLMNLKADRKFLNGVFDYLNEKITLLSSDSNQQELMMSIKKLEVKLKDLTQPTSASDSIGSGLNGTGMGVVSGSAANLSLSHGQLLNATDPLKAGANNLSMDQGILGSTRCLSCNRSFSHNAYSPVAQKSKWLDYPPSSIPNLPSVYNMDTSRRLESYRHWIQKGEKSAMEASITNSANTPQAEHSFLGGGFKHITPIRPTSASSGGAAARGHTSISFASSNDAYLKGILSGSMSQLNISMPTPPVSAPNGARGKINRSRQQRKAPQSARGARVSKLSSGTEAPGGSAMSGSVESGGGTVMPDYLKSKVDYTSMALDDESSIP
uniref:Uncharacterized protein n=1 Tax=Percolomonas cosmopolitus TaxID=63605 RepID=A0A7S1PI26_9EUKA